MDGVLIYFGDTIAGRVRFTNYDMILEVSNGDFKEFIRYPRNEGLTLLDARERIIKEYGDRRNG